jgi:hypothetical protein
MFARTTLLAVAAAVLAWVVGCTAEEEVTPAGAVADEALRILDHQEGPQIRFVALRRDLRRCPSPRCGGYWVRPLNLPDTAEEYVAALEFSLSGFTPAEEAAVRGADDGLLVVEGTVSRPQGPYGARVFHVFDAYVGVAGAAEIDAHVGPFYRVIERDPPIYCFVAPCNNVLAIVVNGDEVVEATRVVISAKLERQIDPGWLIHRLFEHGAVVHGLAREGDSLPGGREIVLAVEQVHVRVSDLGNCALQDLADGTVDGCDDRP